MTCCNNNCNQGRECPVRKHQELHVTMEDNPFEVDWVLEMVRDFFAALGFIAMIVIIAGVYGYLT